MLIIVVLVVIIVIIVVSIIKGKKDNKERQKRYQEIKRQQEIENQKQEIEKQKYEQELIKAKSLYEEALNGKDKRDALNKGRVYYALLRNGVSALTEDYSTELSSRDESRIRTDLQTMKV